MKKLTTLCLIIVSLTVSAQNIDCNTIAFGANLSSNFNHVVGNITNTMDDTIFEIEMAEQDAPFDFDIQTYLPKDFNPFKLMYSAYNVAFEYFNEDEDETFDFDTKKYLPENFNPYEEASILEDYAMLNAEEDEMFDFNTIEFLPKDFNAYSEKEMNMENYELLHVEADAPFDFNTVDYLPVSFNS